MHTGHSWFILGNAYLAQFFSSMSTAEHLRQALKAYRQAEADVAEVKNNPDLHYNRAVVRVMCVRVCVCVCAVCVFCV